MVAGRAATHFWLVVQQDDARHRFRLDREVTLIGQSAECDLRLVHPTVSRKHATLVRDGDAFQLQDHGSTNGSFLDNERVERGRVEAGRLLRFGSVSARIERHAASDMPLRIDLDNEFPQPEAAMRTQLGSASARFVLVELPELIASVRTSHGPGALARGAVAALARTFPALELCVAHRLDGSDALLAGSVGLEESSPAVAVVESGAFRFAWKADGAAAELPALLGLIAQLLRLVDPESSAPRAPSVAAAPALPEPGISDQRVREIYRLAGRIGPARDVHVLIEGESGTGKELLAAYLHAASAAAGPLLALNCAALAHDLLAAELFGIEKGVATGVDARPGKFELADGGTLFLDEIGEMSPDVQSQMLRVLQDGQVLRIGARVPRKVDVRIIAATNRDLRQLTERGAFRLDLYHRIADWSVTLPPLRERPADLLALAAHFLESEARRRGLARTGLSRDAVDVLRAYDWPGNIRELEREMRRAALFLDNGQVLDATQLSERIRSGGDRGGGRESVLDEATLRDAIAAAKGNMSAAAERLGVARSTLYRRLKSLGIDPADIAD